MVSDFFDVSVADEFQVTTTDDAAVSGVDVPAVTSNDGGGKLLPEVFVVQLTGSTAFD